MYVQNIDITTTYTDASGVVKTHTVKSRDLSSSWVIEKYDENHLETNGELVPSLSSWMIEKYKGTSIMLNSERFLK